MLSQSGALEAEKRVSTGAQNSLYVSTIALYYVSIPFSSLKYS